MGGMGRNGEVNPEKTFQLQTFQSALLTFHSFGFLLIDKQFETPRRKLNPLFLALGLGHYFIVHF